ncbi:ubiquinol-cytochrome c reductase iron-sulfur subunit [Egicoccus sp. AB-alg2]|uniref:QcrA and Rieske domain-containing protein n=1 Tax=Egicoccus sp. AB-alg2 TaxID=3242693 RepID=UPI00359E6916
MSLPERRPGGRLPTEPTGPSRAAGDFRRGWVLGWSAACGVALVVLLGLWVLDADTAVLALVAAVAAGSASVALHHVVVTQDEGERTVPRPPEPDDVVPLAGRRRLFGGALAGAAVLGIGAAGGLLAFGSRRPAASAWAGGGRLTQLDGSPVRPEDVPPGGVVTVWPPDAVGTELAAVMLIRLREPPEPPTRVDEVADDTLIAYSRLCTHAGCAVALYRDFDQALFCPCHQATFDARRGGQPTFGPASVPLPQLPLAIDDDGFLVATGDLSAPPGAVGGTL